jgi:hypothetical protein
MRAESEYRPFGTLAYLAAYDVHRAQVITTGTHRTRWPHETRRINGRDH